MAICVIIFSSYKICQIWYRHWLMWVITVIIGIAWIAWNMTLYSHSSIPAITWNPKRPAAQPWHTWFAHVWRTQLSVVCCACHYRTHQQLDNAWPGAITVRAPNVTRYRLYHTSQAVGVFTLTKIVAIHCNTLLIWQGRLILQIECWLPLWYYDCINWPPVTQSY